MIGALPMTAATGYARGLLAAAMLVALAACTTTDMASVEEPAPAPMTGQTNDPAPGFENVRPGSEEEFILNVGRRIYFTQDRRRSILSPWPLSTARRRG